MNPSHATGDWKLVESASLAAIAAGADGLIIEVHDDPENAMSDGVQSLLPEKFDALVEKGRKDCTCFREGSFMKVKIKPSTCSGSITIPPSKKHGPSCHHMCFFNKRP